MVLKNQGRWTGCSWVAWCMAGVFVRMIKQRFVLHWLFTKWSTLTFVPSYLTLRLLTLTILLNLYTTTILISLNKKTWCDGYSLQVVCSTGSTTYSNLYKRPLQIRITSLGRPLLFWSQGRMSNNVFVFVLLVYQEVTLKSNSNSRENTTILQWIFLIILQCVENVDWFSMLFSYSVTSNLVIQNTEMTQKIRGGSCLYRVTPARCVSIIYGLLL